MTGRKAVSSTRTVLPAIRIFVVLTVLTGLVYPLVITAVAQLALPYQANGSLVRNSRGEVVGSELIGQVFSRPEYFHPRPSAAGDGYDAAASGGSNLGPTNRRLLAAVGERVLAFRQENGLDSETPVPADAVTASASGLDPHITPANAYLQVRRVARTRGLPEETVRELVDRFIEAPLFGFLGQPRVNVVKLNRALDELKEGWK